MRKFSFEVVVILPAVFVACGSSDKTCFDSMDCAFGQACRDAKCAVVKCVSQQACVPEVELCADLTVAAQDGTRRACTAPCGVFHRCPSGQFCRDKVCWESEGDEPDAGQDVPVDVAEQIDVVVPDDGEPPDLQPPVDGPCLPKCGAVECGMDPICGSLYCGSCAGTEACLDGKCVWQPGQYEVICFSDGMCQVSAGSFWMGCNSLTNDECSSDETPYHEVDVSSFFIDKTEVTQVEYKKCVDVGTCSKPSCNWNPGSTPMRPVVCVTWSQAETYCSWMDKRLPTEAEWEKAARGIDGRRFPWGVATATCENAVMDNGVSGCGTGGATDVCRKSPNGDSPYGACDMAGNVSEWVHDWYGSSYYNTSPESDPTGPENGTVRVRRGGSYLDVMDSLTVSFRGVDNPSVGYPYLGFRCADDGVIPGEFGFRGHP